MNSGTRLSIASTHVPDPRETSPVPSTIHGTHQTPMHQLGWSGMNRAHYTTRQSRTARISVYQAPGSNEATVQFPTRAGTDGRLGRLLPCNMVVEPNDILVKTATPVTLPNGLTSSSMLISKHFPVTVGGEPLTSSAGDREENPRTNFFIENSDKTIDVFTTKGAKFFGDCSDAKNPNQSLPTHDLAVQFHPPTVLQWDNSKDQRVHAICQSQTYLRRSFLVDSQNAFLHVEPLEPSDRDLWPESRLAGYPSGYYETAVLTWLSNDLD